SSSWCWAPPRFRLTNGIEARGPSAVASAVSALAVALIESATPPIRSISVETAPARASIHSVQATTTRSIATTSERRHAAGPSTGAQPLSGRAAAMCLGIASKVQRLVTGDSLAPGSCSVNVRQVGRTEVRDVPAAGMADGPGGRRGPGREVRDHGSLRSGGGARGFRRGVAVRPLPHRALAAARDHVRVLDLDGRARARNADDPAWSDGHLQQLPPA